MPWDRKTHLPNPQPPWLPVLAQSTLSLLALPSNCWAEMLPLPTAVGYRQVSALEPRGLLGNGRFLTVFCKAAAPSQPLDQFVREKMREGVQSASRYPALQAADRAWSSASPRTV